MRCKRNNDQSLSSAYIAKTSTGKKTTYLPKEGKNGNFFSTGFIGISFRHEFAQTMNSSPLRVAFLFIFIYFCLFFFQRKRLYVRLYRWRRFICSKIRFNANTHRRALLTCCIKYTRRAVHQHVNRARRS